MSDIRDDDSSEVGPRLQRTLYQLSTSAGRTLDPGELVKLVAEQAGALLSADAVAVYLWDDATELLMPVFSNDPRQPIADQPLRSGQGAAGQAIERGESVVVDDYQSWEQAIAWGVERGLKSVEALPLMVGGRPIGALVIRFYSERPRTGPEDERMLHLLAAQAAPALEGARLYASSSLERQHERALREITQALAQNLDERYVLELSVHYSAELFRAPYARVWLLESNGELGCAAAKGFVHAETFKRRLAPESTSGRAARQPVVNLANAPTEPSWRFNREFGERTGLGAYLGAGLWRAGESLGVIEVMREAGHRFNDVEEQLLVSLANAVAVAVSNARTHAAVEHLAREAEQRAEAVAESEQVLRSTYEAIGSGVLVFDLDGNVINANGGAALILGRPVEELMRMHVSGFEPGLREDGLPMPVEERPGPRAARTQQEQRKVVLGIAKPDGRLRWLLIDAVPLFSPDGSLSRVVSSFIDITEQKASEEALRHRDAILQAVAFAAEKLLTAPEWEHSIDDVLARLGAATGVSRVYIVPSVEDASAPLQAAPHEWTARGVAPRVDMPAHGSYLESVGLAAWETTLREGGIIQGSLRSFVPNEQVMLAAQGVCSLVVVPIFVGSTWWGFIGFDDCAEERSWSPSTVEVLKTAANTLGAGILRRQAEAERLQLVREQSARVEAEAGQRRLGFLAEASQILAGSLDYETNMQGVADLVAPGLADGCFVDVSDVGGSTRRIAAAFGPGVSDTGSESLVTDVLRTGHARLEPRALAVPLITRAGVTGALTWVVSTTRPAFEAHDLDLAEHLARRCALAIDNSRLYREARSAVSLRDEFLSVAAHELKTPMTSLRGYAQLLAREFDRGQVNNPDRARRAASTIQVQSDKLARLVGQLLDVSRLQSGKLAIERKPTDLGELLREVVDTARTQLKDHTLVARVPNEQWASIDPLRIEQVITNLIDNAIKYSPNGGQIDIGLKCDAEHEEVLISVRDRGVGVPLEHRAHIFDRFYQAHAGGALTSMAGMGLGLYISRQIVELHDGTIDAEFPDDGGTRFVVRLPLPQTRPPVSEG